MIGTRGELNYYLIIKCLCRTEDVKDMVTVINNYTDKLKSIARKQKAEVVVNPEVIEQKKKSLITYIISCTSKGVIEWSNPKKHLSDKYENITVQFKNIQ